MIFLLAADHKRSGADRAWEWLRAGRSALDAAEHGVRAVEANLDDVSVGKGGYPNALGEVELDGGVMDGRTRASGAVAALRGYRHPVSVARAVMQRLPHVLLVGEGACRFAAEIGAEPDELLTEAMRVRYREWQAAWGVDPGDPRAPLITAVNGGKDPQHMGGTTVFLARDARGDLAAATSTCGWAWKYPGRVGDTPIAGAGFYADNRYGAAGCTGRGEIAIRSGLARATVAFLQMGLTAEAAVRTAMADLATLQAGQRGITLYAVSADGEAFVGQVREPDQPPAGYYWASGDNAAPVRLPAVDLT